jgi:hypothetical protein
VIRKGNHTYAAAVALGWDRIAVSRSELEGDLARAYSIGDNRASDLARNDNPELVAELDDLAAISTDLLASTGYTPEDLDMLHAVLEPPPPEERGSGSGDVDPVEEGTNICPRCGHEW